MSVFTVLQQHGADNPTILPYVRKKETTKNLT
jgi:hypothetical protein